ncbi:MAG: dehydrogenase, partial [Planctomycetaceae bacterium]|nr:dehydrogenase [Planctomycetaceae bacterium]
MSRPVQALLSLIAISICGPLVSSARAEERPNVIPTALPLEFIPQQIDVPEGFSIELVAGPPLVEHPTFATFDDHGKLYVCNNAGVNLSADDLEAQLPNSINLLEDTDGDGKFDKSTVFADKMTFPMGGVWHEGSLYVASPPNIWRLTDTTGDGIADKRDIIVDRFGFSGNGASIHGCFLGPDCRLYWCDGYHGHEFKDKDGNVTTSRKGSYIFSSTIAGTDVRRHSGGGMDNPVEVDFTPAGEVLGTVNIFYTRPRADCLVHWLHGGAYPHREQVLAELQTTGPVLGPVHQFGHVAISGTLRYRSGALNHQWRDNMFATFFN